ncbi:MAG TPA: hypothetical protein VE195_08320 [Acidobacteriaceae bacterium]|nr:hypothetical protein [Acidobacteriaceae bacterium]
MKTRSLTLSAADNEKSEIHEITINPDSAPVLFSPVIPSHTRANLVRMFRDPYLLREDERVEIIRHLREAIALESDVPELRVLLGMALCVNFEAQTAMEELRESVRMAPDNFLARLKFGELLMRLRVCSQAAEETQIAASLAANPVQAELARRQAATIRTMMREGIERGNYSKLLSAFQRIGRLFPQANQDQAAVTVKSR